MSLLERPLPPSVFLHHGAYYFSTTIEGKQRWVPLGRVLDEALSKHRKYVETHKSHRYVMRSFYSDESQNIGGIPLSRLREMLRVVAKRAKSRGLACTLTMDHMLALAKRAAGKCELSGIPFDIGGSGHNKKRLWAPSVDRRDCARGYEPNNVRLICAAVNIALQDFGDDALLRIAKGVLKVAKKKAKAQRNQAGNYGPNGIQI